MLAVMLFAGKRRGWPFNLIAGTSLLLVAWSLLMIWASVNVDNFAALILLDTPHSVAVLLILGQIIRRSASSGWLRNFGLLLPWAGVVPCVLLLAISRFEIDAASAIAFYSVIGVALLGLLAIEQIYRNTRPEQRNVMGLISAAFGVILVFDFFVYTNGMLVGGLNAQLWSARGFVNALAVPVLIVALKKDPHWESNLFVSRQVVFYTASLIGVGAYLLIMAFGGTLIQRFGGEWAAAVQSVFFAASLLMLVLILFSPQLRRRVRVFLAKHFYRNRYDYREEWLKLIRRLSEETSRIPMSEQCLYALADILDSDGGGLWLHRTQGGGYVLASSFGPFDGASQLNDDHPIVSFLRRTGWIVDGLQYRNDPSAYDQNFDVDGDDAYIDDRVFIPIVLGEELTGVAALNRPSGLPILNFEDHDLLRTVVRQLAVFLAQDQAREMIAETRQFELFNRLTAFVMHDLKNLIAQQSLVVSNAAKHKSNPQFVDDAIDTIANSVRRMNHLLEQLQGGSVNRRASTVDIGSVLNQVVSDAAGRLPVPDLYVDGESMTVLADQERLDNVLRHMVRNAQDATPSDGVVAVRVSTVERDPHGRYVRIDITDNGEGMSPDFVRDLLFKPFYSTKGAQGMGIGAYQARDYIDSIGGAVEVDTELGRGTTFTILLPAVASRSASPLPAIENEDRQCEST